MPTVPKNLKHNTLVQVSVPRPRELYKQYGFQKNLDTSKYSEEENINPGMSKLDGARVAIEAEKELIEKQNAQKID